MYSVLLAIIYVAFISLGLPDSLVGSAWPVMQGELGVPLSYAGVITMIISLGTIVSSLLSDRLTRRFGAGLVTAGSVFMTAMALLGFSSASAFWQLCLLAIPYGLGAGAVDAALNNYVALHYASRHMSWLHCFWGVGAAISPYIMSYCLAGGLGWNHGYRVVSVLQFVLTAVLFCSLPLWRKTSQEGEDASSGRALRLCEIFRMAGVPLVLITFFAYCAVEQTAGLWASSYLVRYRGVDKELAAQFGSLFFLGITFGRFLCGFITDRLGDRRMIRYGILLALLGIGLVALPLATDVCALAGLVVIGLGCAPVYPCVIHSTPALFGKNASQSIIGVQMASAYVGTTFMPPLFGWIATHISIAWYPIYLLFFALLMLLTSEWLHRVTGKGEANA